MFVLQVDVRCDLAPVRTFRLGIKQAQVYRDRSGV